MYIEKNEKEKRYDVMLDSRREFDMYIEGLERYRSVWIMKSKGHEDCEAYKMFINVLKLILSQLNDTAEEKDGFIISFINEDDLPVMFSVLLSMMAVEMDEVRILTETVEIDRKAINADRELISEYKDNIKLLRESLELYKNIMDNLCKKAGWPELPAVEQ